VWAADIDWIEAADNYVSLHTRDGSHLLRTTIDAMDSRLVLHGFVRVHRSRIVNLERVVSLRPMRHGEYAMTLRNGETVLSGRSYKDAIRRHWPLPQ
jgi:two-component system LytT family response regulator